MSPGPGFRARISSCWDCRDCLTTTWYPRSSADWVRYLATRAWNGTSKSSTTIWMMPLRRLRSMVAATLAWYPMLRATCLILARFASLTFGLSRNALDTVISENPVARATSASVTGPDTPAAGGVPPSCT
nr:hypothetical protein [Bifidobacterium scardovii]